MTRLGPPTPRVFLGPDPQAPEVSAALGAALDVLADAGRVHRVSAKEPADIDHTIGSAAAAHTGERKQVHSPLRVPLRGPRLAATSPWVRHERHRLRTATWLTHGQSACRVVLEAGLAAGDRLHCAPLLAPDLGRCGPREVERAAIRDWLGVPPGTHLVAYLPAAARGLPWDDDEWPWERQLSAVGRGDIAVLGVRPAGHGQYLARFGLSPWRGRTLPLGSWLAACDVFVAADPMLTAWSPAAAAAACGLPLVATTTDSGAELVLGGSPGLVVRAGGGDLVRAVLAVLDDPPPRRANHVQAQAPEQRVAAVARAMLRCYRSALARQPVRAA